MTAMNSALIVILKMVFMPDSISIFRPKRVNAGLQAVVMGLLAALIALPAPSLSADATPQAVVLMYHRVGEDNTPSTSLSVEQFRAHLAYLDAQQFNVIPLSQVVRALQQGSSLPAKSIAITFDDGYASVGEVAHDLLAERDWPYTVFVNTEPVDAGLESHLSWSQMRAMAARGAEFANHSHTHTPLFVRNEGESEADWQARINADIGQAQTRLVDELGAAALTDPPLLAYPYGEYDLDVLALIENAGYVGFGQQSGAIGPTSNLLALPRYPMNERYAALDGFAVKASSKALPVRAKTPANPVRDTAQPPRWVVTLTEEGLPGTSPTCFYGNERLHPEWLIPGQQFAVQGEADLPIGRSRYNCTAPDGEGGFYWLSQMWIYAEAGT
jgi:peptidoglycan/xylan/chitin deacetylase (PgdA/CDA1 family)